MNREQLRNELPEPVRRYFEEVARMNPPDDLMDAAIAQVEAQPRVNRFSMLPAFAALAATAVLAAIVAFGVFGVKLGPPIGTDASPSPTGEASPTPEASPSELPIMTPPPLEGLPSAGTIEARYPIGNAGGPALAAHGSIWLSNGETGVVSRLDPDTGEIIAEIQANPDPGSTRYDQSLVADDSFVWATGVDDTLVKIDPATNTVVERIDIGTLVYRMQVHGGDIWITGLDQNNVLRVDATTGEVTFEAPIGGWPGGLAVTDDAVWMTPYQLDDLVQIDPASGAVVERYTVGSFGMAIIPLDDALFITGNQSRPLERYSISEARVTARFGEDTNVALLDGRLYSVYRGTLLTLNPDTLQVTAALEIGQEAGGAIPGEGFLWILDGSDLVKVRPS